MKKPEVFSNERVSASAGTGKTYRLTTRFIALCAREYNPKTRSCDPTKIAALTFTRKAGAEFLSSILLRLSDAVLDDGKCALLIRDVREAFAPPSGAAAPLSDGYKARFLDGIGKTMFYDILKACLENLDKLRLSTIDAFCLSILRAHARELGLCAPVNMLSAAAARRAHADALEEAVARFGNDDKAFEAFSLVVRRASFADAEKSAKKFLENLVADSHSAWLETPDSGAWGNIEAFVKFPFSEWNAAEYADIVESLCASAIGTALEKPMAKVLGFLKNSSPARIDSGKGAVLGRVLELFANSSSFGNGFDVKYGKSVVHVSGEFASRLEGALRMLYNARLAAVGRSSKSCRALLSAYDAVYNARFRTRGSLDFDDIYAMLLNPVHALDNSLLQYRLDTRISHWLFDEFQDTSRPQWRVFENLIDEAALRNVENSSSTFFYVGDVKQSLYSFRGGTADLFDEIADSLRRKYGADAIYDAPPMNESRRSGANVIKAVNAVFGNAQRLALAFPAAAAAKFSEMFRPHVSAETVPNSGKSPSPNYAELSLVDRPAARDRFSKVDAAILRTAEIIARCNPLERGLTCAVLVRDNETVRLFVDGLRSIFASSGRNIAVAEERDEKSARNNMVWPLFLAVARGCAHPSDGISREYVKAAGFADYTSGFSDAFARRICSLVSAEGYGAFADDFAAFAEAKYPSIDAFNAAYLEELKNACAEFDALENFAGKNFDSLADFLSGRDTHLTSAAKSVQVMTVHKSKGLTFSMTVLPDLAVASAGGGERGFVNVDGCILGGLSGNFCAMDASLAAFAEKRRLEKAFDDICRNYVALTRASNALYILVPKPDSKNYAFPSESDGGNIPMSQHLFDSFYPEVMGAGTKDAAKELLEEIVATSPSRGIGDAEWFAHFSATEAADKKDEVPLLSADVVELEKENGRECIVKPSSAEGGAEASKASPDGAEAEFGRKIHAVFAEFEFPSDKESLPEWEILGLLEVKYGGELGADLHVLRTAAAALSKPEFAALFVRADNVRTLTEMPFFSKNADGKTVRGVMDRVLIFENALGVPTRAVVADFKPSSVNAAEKYAVQLGLYKAAVCRIFGLKEGSVEAVVASYGDGRTVRM